MIKWKTNLTMSRYLQYKSESKEYRWVGDEMLKRAEEGQVGNFAGRQRNSRGEEEQESRGAVERRSRREDEQESRGAGEQRSRREEEQESRGAEEHMNIRAGRRRRRSGIRIV